MTVAEALQAGLQHHHAGRLADAEGIYRQILAVDPRHAAALHLLGVIAHQVGRDDVAVEMILAAIAVAPGEPSCHSNLGEAYRKLGRQEEAMAAYRRAIELQADFPEAHYNLGNVLKERGELSEALASYRRAIAFKPEYADAHNNAGVVLADLGHFEEAIESFRRAIQLNPGNPEAHNNLGNSLRDKGDVAEAAAASRRALQLRPGFPEAYNNLGNALRDQCQLGEAIANYRAALRLKPDFADAWNNLGGSLKDQGILDDAIAAYRRALELKPAYAKAHGNLIYGLQYLPDCDAGEIFREHCRWDESHARPFAKFIEPHTNVPEPGRRLRVGYVSPDFREHSVAFFLEGLLASHDPAELEVFCYADLHDADAFTARFREHAHQWRKIAGMTDEQVAAIVRSDRIDILVDLAGHTARNRLLAFARKPAPVQVSWLGYSNTTGMTVMDYRFTDAHADPPGTTEHLHTEKLIRLPDTFACFRPAEGSPPVGPLPALGRGQVTFGSLHMLAKLNDRLLGWWAAILNRVPESRLLMVASGIEDDSCRRRYADFFGRHGIASSRLEFRGRQTLADYLALHQELDVLLDSHPFSGHTVSCHALWMGVPVVTLAGKTHPSRMVTSVLMNLGHPEWIARAPEEYVDIASALAADLPGLATLRAGLRGQMASSPLMDASRFARNVERAFRQMWSEWCAKQPANLPS